MYVYAMIAYFTINNMKHILPKNHKYCIENSVFFNFYGVSKCEQTCFSWFWKVGKLALKKICKYD